MALAFALLSVMVICELPPTRMFAGANALVTVGAGNSTPGDTFRVALASMPVLALALETLPV